VGRTLGNPKIRVASQGRRITRFGDFLHESRNATERFGITENPGCGLVGQNRKGSRPGFPGAYGAERSDRRNIPFSFNPLRHIDPIGTTLLPGLLLLNSPFLFRLCQAGAGQLSSSAQSATRHGLGSGGRARDQYCARHTGCTGLPLHRLLANDRGPVDRREFKRADLEAIDLVR
jgi:hypothetical protein